MLSQLFNWIKNKLHSSSDSPLSNQNRIQENFRKENEVIENILHTIKELDETIESDPLTEPTSEKK